MFKRFKFDVSWPIVFLCITCAAISLWPKKFKVEETKFKYSITDVQQILIDSGYPLPEHGVDGKCGREMTNAWNLMWLEQNNF